MSFLLENVDEKIKQIQLFSRNNNQIVTVKKVPKGIKCIGMGTDAAVFQLLDAPQFAFKVFSQDKLKKLEREKQVYTLLGDSNYFPSYYSNGTNYLVLSFEEGLTLYECLLKGVRIPEQAIVDVERAREFARSKGLNPRDIHLKNILLQGGRAVVLDVSEYLNEGNDHRWEYLKEGYYEYYTLIAEKKVPYWVIETVRKWYNQSHPGRFQLHSFVQKVLKIVHIESEEMKR
ncbi:serine/threonine protein kinase [Halalkalibacter krulwichiae]|uniref:Serine/threonine protein kinase n=1 Tax=Halalkalibacter krulwichiae TaxID=199441 RepID=A0A1X9MBP9_9BACI|nr:serine/threonine protein kinase [Halalkalibacter krulwichiae]ARK29583.1 hypothetical protein BkAM31D_06750 [Halalkalibacter krulwichiae]